MLRVTNKVFNILALDSDHPVVFCEMDDKKSVYAIIKLIKRCFLYYSSLQSHLYFLMDPVDQAPSWDLLLA